MEVRPGPRPSAGERAGAVVAVAVAVAVLTVLAGCTVSMGGPTATPTADSGPDAAVDAEVTVTVTRVVDGDTAKVRYPNGTEDTVRFVGVDTPETKAANAPGEYPGVPDTEAGRTCLRDAGEAAATFTAERIEGERVGLRFDPNLDRRGYYGRLLAYVVVDGTTLNYELVERGHARVYDSPFAERERYERTVDGAIEQRRGLWQCVDPAAGSDRGSGDGPLRIVDVTPDPPGNDNDNLGEETVTLANVGDDPLDLSGWTVSDAADHEYQFPDGVTLAPGERVTLHTGHGSDAATDLYWGLDRAVWNNDGDTVTVRDADGGVVAERSY